MLINRESHGTSSLHYTIKEMDELRYGTEYGKQMLAFLQNLSSANLSDPNVRNKLIDALRFFAAMKGQKYVSPDGHVIDFSKFSTSQGFFGADTAKFDALLQNILKSFNTTTLRDGWNDDQQITNQAGQPVTFLDILQHPNDTYTFKFWLGSNSNYNKSTPDWASGCYGSGGALTLEDKFDITLPNGGTVHVEHTGDSWTGSYFKGSGSGTTFLNNCPIGVDAGKLKSSGDALADFLNNEM